VSTTDNSKEAKVTEPSKTRVDMATLVSLCQRRGFIFPSSEIYGGLGSCWDYGPLGVELKRNIKEAWWRSMVRERDDMVGLDTSIMMHPRVWEASGHIAGFSDPLIECRACNQRFRPDQVYVRQVSAGNEFLGYVSSFNTGELEKKALELAKPHEHKPGMGLAPTETRTVHDFGGDVTKVPCPFCGKMGQFTEPQQFNLMFKTFMGPVEEQASVVYLRPETAQGMFVNFENVVNSTRRRLPFGIAQTGKSFRNEVTTGNFIFRSREFEQMEIEYFVKPETAGQWFDYWVQERLNWFVKIGIKRESLKLRQHSKKELAHYAKDCYDVNFLFPMGWSELEGIASRGDFDLTQHSKYSGKALSYFDEETKQHIVPWVVEPSAGVDRTFLAVLTDAYDEEVVAGEKRVVLRLNRELAPYKVAVLPLSRKENLAAVAREVGKGLRACWNINYDDAQSIGRRYRRQDEIGTPFCVTVDFQSLEDKMVTIRERDSLNQIRVPMDTLAATLAAKFAGEDFLALPTGGQVWKKEENNG
jgi:glycyl-tRNA synthetase